MRTTLTLDDDVVVLLERARQRRQAPLKEIVNDALRVGLATFEEGPPRRAPYRTRVVSLGRPKVPNVDDISEVLALAEGEAFR